MNYYALYETDFGWEDGEQPSGIIITKKVYAPDWSSMEYNAIHWHHRLKAWVYDPRRCADFLSEEHNEYRQRSIERPEAESITPAITGGEELPNEETSDWIIQWKGEPPQAEDSAHRWAWDR